MENIKTQVHTCFHCGNTGLMRYIGKTGWKHEDVAEDYEGNIVSYTLIEHEDWYVFECPVCNKPVIISEYTIDVADTPLNGQQNIPQLRFLLMAYQKKFILPLNQLLKPKVLIIRFVYFRCAGSLK